MDYERAYATVIMVIGATVFGYIVGSVSALASNPNGSQARETVKILAVSNYLGEKKVQPKLRQVRCRLRCLFGFGLGFGFLRYELAQGVVVFTVFSLSVCGGSSVTTIVGFC